MRDGDRVVLSAPSVVWVRARAVLVGCLVCAGCSPVNEHPPDQLLRDSLGLDDDDVVHRIHVRAVDHQETMSPVRLQVEPGSHVEFVSTDRRLHWVRFELDSLDAAAADFLRAASQEESPPLVNRESRFVVTFRGAPEGLYPYVVYGNGRSGRGAIVVGGEGGDGDGPGLFGILGTS